MKINIYRVWFCFVIAIFILSERCINLFGWLDKIHLKHYLLIASILLGILMFKKKKGAIILKKEFYSILGVSIVLYFISLGYQLINGEFQFYSLEELYYFIAPIFFSFIIFNMDKEQKIEKYVDVVLYVGLFSFFVTRLGRGTLTFQNIVGLFNIRSLFIDSVSLISESDLSVYFLILTVYYAFKQRKFKFILAIIGTFLGYKRIAVLFLALFLIIYKFLPKNKEVNKSLWKIICMIFIISPFTVYFMCQDSFASWFYAKFNIDFNTFTMTRFDIINTVIDADLKNYGLGTVTDFLERRGISGQTNMHNDILRIFMECGIIGTVIFTFNFLKLGRNNYYSFFIMVFVFVELFVAHFLGPGSVSLWILIYLVVFDINNKSLNFSEEKRCFT